MVYFTEGCVEVRVKASTKKQDYFQKFFAYQEAQGKD